MLTTSPSLLQRLRFPGAGNEWERFVELYSPILCHWARKLGIREQDVNDFVQEVFCVLVKELPQFEYDQVRRFRAWLWTVVVNKLREQRRRNSIRTDEFDVELLNETTADPADDIAEAEYRSMVIRRAAELIQNDFEPITWLAFWEFVVGERPARSVAVQLQITENAVYLAKARVLRRLRAELNGLVDGV